VANIEREAVDTFAPIWEHVCELLKAKLGAKHYLHWVSPLRVVSADTQRVVLGASTPFECDRVQRLHGELIAQLIAREAPEFGRVEFTVDRRPIASALARKAAQATTSAAATSAPPVVAGSIPLNRDCTFANFVTGRSNEVALTQALRTAEADRPAANPLFLFGATGLGKSHLSHAIATRVLELDPAKRVLYISAEWFLRNFVAAVRGGDPTVFKNLVRDVDLLIVDDLHFIVGKDATTEEFLHTFDALADANKQIVITADRSPALLEKLSDRVRSRLLKGMSVEITASDFDLRLAILEAKAARIARERPNVVIGGEALRFMAQRIAANTRELEGALNRVLSHSGDGMHPITLPNLQIWLADFLKQHDRRVTIDEIKTKTATFFSRKVSDLESESRARDIVRPRQIAMYLSRRLTNRSLPDIARRFGKKDHTTVIHAVKTVEALSNSDPEFARNLETIRLSIRNWPSEPPVAPPSDKA
jgi:chromosomal replication initiator protein